MGGVACAYSVLVRSGRDPSGSGRDRACSLAVPSSERSRTRPCVPSAADVRRFACLQVKRVCRWTAGDPIFGGNHLGTEVLAPPSPVWPVGTRRRVFRFRVERSTVEICRGGFRSDSSRGSRRCVAGREARTEAAGPPAADEWLRPRVRRGCGPSSSGRPRGERLAKGGHVSTAPAVNEQRTRLVRRGSVLVVPERSCAPRVRRSSLRRGSTVRTGGTSPRLRARQRLVRAEVRPFGCGPGAERRVRGFGCAATAASDRVPGCDGRRNDAALRSGVGLEADAHGRGVTRLGVRSGPRAERYRTERSVGFPWPTTSRIEVQDDWLLR